MDDEKQSATNEEDSDGEVLSSEAQSNTAANAAANKDVVAAMALGMDQLITKVIKGLTAWKSENAKTSDVDYIAERVAFELNKVSIRKTVFSKDELWLRDAVSAALKRYKAEEAPPPPPAANTSGGRRSRRRRRGGKVVKRATARRRSYRRY